MVVLGAALPGAALPVVDVAELLLEAAFWSVVLGVLGVCAGGFTGALALFWSVVGVWLLPVAAGGLLWFDALVEGDAFWSGDVAGAVEVAALLGLVAWAFEAEASAAVVPAAAPAPEAWLLVQESEIMFTELT